MDLPPMRPIVVVDQDKGENRFTAAAWDDDRACWVTNDGTVLDGKPPEDAPEVLVAINEAAPDFVPSDWAPSRSD